MSTRDGTSRIDRRAVLARHRVALTEPHPEHVVSVGNGDFAYTADIPGMQTFPEFHDPVAAQARQDVALNTATMSSWAWHEMPNPDGFTLDDAMTTHDTPRGPVSYPDKHDLMAAMSGEVGEGYRAGAWLNANPQRLDLGRIGFELRRAPGGEVETDPSVLSETRQVLDVATGIVTSSFVFDGERVGVVTAAAPDRSVVSFRITSPLLRDGRARVVLRFPYASDGFFQTSDWTAENRHTSTLTTSRGGVAVIDRQLDGTRYVVEVASTAGHLEATAPHTFALSGAAEAVDLVVRFGPTATRMPLPDARSVEAASDAAFGTYWESGAALDVSGSTDPRALELERRVVLSQYLTRVHSAGVLPPQETGLVTNSWQGKFHLEMHLWHAGHFAAWGRPELVERSLDWYRTILDEARATAARQGYPGARWPKQTGPDGRESPDQTGSFIAWQQPHIVHLLELVWRASSPQHREVLVARYSEVVAETAAFMVAFLDDRDGALHLGPPIMPAQEFYDPTTTTDPTFELAYWWWALDVAQTWRERAGLGRDSEIQDVLDRIASPARVGDRYAAVATDAPLRRDDHPSLLMAFGLVPPTPIVDPVVVRATLDEVRSTWEWPTAWGWDFPVMAMTAARLGDPALALDALLRDEQKNHYTAVGHNPQMGALLPLYLPGNGSLLLAVALLAQDAAAGFQAPGWSVRVEGFVPLPTGSPFDPARASREVEVGRAEPAPAEPLTADSTIGAWLEHPVGGAALGALLERIGAGQGQLAALKGVPLSQLVTLSQGRLPQQLVDDLVDGARQPETTNNEEGDLS